MKTGLMVHSYKGFRFFERIIEDPDFDVCWVASYKNCDRFDAYTLLRRVCKGRGLPFLCKSEINYDAEVVFIAGWQYMIADVRENCIVLHDSLLPRYRGFCPTVTALINGDSEIGVTAVAPVEEMDAGLIYGQSSTPVSYPVKIKDAYDQLAGCYMAAAKESISRIETGDSAGRGVSYSLWRDEDDYQVNWSWPAARVVRFVDAVGFPYDGAKCAYGSVLQAEVIEDVCFENRCPGKAWRRNGALVDVVCGEGMVRIVLEPSLTKLRCRL